MSRARLAELCGLSKTRLRAVSLAPFLSHQPARGRLSAQSDRLSCGDGAVLVLIGRRARDADRADEDPRRVTAQHAAREGRERLQATARRRLISGPFAPCGALSSQGREGALLAAAPAVPMARSCGILGPMPEAKRGAGDCTIKSSQLAFDGVGATQFLHPSRGLGPSASRQECPRRFGTCLAARGSSSACRCTPTPWRAQSPP